MADNSSAATLVKSRSDATLNGDSNTNSSTSGNKRGDRDSGRGRGRGGSKGRGAGRGFGSKDPGGRKKKDVGRGEWSRTNIDKRARNEEGQAAKRRKIERGDDQEPSAFSFTKEEIEGEARKPKRKVAVMIGYAGSGYKGMQINGQEKTIEGDLFKAFVEAGAISKANADDPKKSSLIRCARTDKGVHAAGNVISLKLIVEDPDVVTKINDNLPPQIRVWGMERTNGSFSCYQTCDSRWYEYLIPTYSFLPPHPQSFLGKRLVDSAKKEGTFESYQARQEDAASFWKDAEDKFVKPILDKLDREMRETVMAVVHTAEEENEEIPAMKKTPRKGQKKAAITEHLETVDVQTQEAEFGGPQKEAVPAEDEVAKNSKQSVSNGKDDLDRPEPKGDDSARAPKDGTANGDVPEKKIPKQEDRAAADGTNSDSVLIPLEMAIKEVKAAYILAKKAYRISEYRRQRVQETLDCYIGTCNFHNYTIQKTYSDPSAKRVIRSFKVGSSPVIINDTEWLSLKVHGQSFMMHQIRKMVAMAALIVRCGSAKETIKESMGPANISIPKAPGLGLLLERPVFDSYNERAVKEFDREKIDFDKHQKEIGEFKQKEIYDRIFREEEKDHQFHTFFHHVDNYRSEYFLWATASGVAGAKQSKASGRTDDASDDEMADANGEEG